MSIGVKVHRRTLGKQINKAVRINGSVLQVDIPSSTLDLNVPFSVTIRARRATMSPTSSYIIGSNNGFSEGWSIIEGYNGNEVEWYSPSVGVRTSFGAVMDNLYHTYTAIHDGTNFYLFLDDILMSTIFNAPYPPPNDIQLTIGGIFGAANGGNWTGDIDFISIKKKYNGVMTNILYWGFSDTLTDSASNYTLMNLNVPVSYIIIA